MDSVNPQAPAGNFLGNFGVKFYRYRMLAWRYWWVLLLTGGLGLGFEAWSLHRKPRLFDSSSQVFLREELNTPSDNAKYSLDRENFVGTALAMLKAPEILVRARQRIALETPQYATAEPPEISTALVPHAFIWTVSGRGRDPEYTRRFVDAVVNEFIKFRIESRTQNISNLNGYTKDQIAKLQTDVKEGQAKLQEFITKNNMPFWNEQAKQRADSLSGLKRRQSSLQTELQRLENLTPDQLLNAPPAPAAPRSPAGGEAAGGSGGGESFTSDLYSVYLQRTQELAQAQARLAERSKVWKPKHPKFQALKEAVDEAQRAVDVIKQQNRDQAAQRIDAIKAELKVLAQSTAEGIGG